jgi:hypothetical protein
MATDQSTVTYKDVPGFPGYRVGDDGSVWTCLRRRGRGESRVPGAEWKRMTPGRGRLRPRAGLRVKLHGKFHLVPRLVLMAFVGPCPDGMECCHFPDRDTSNNRLSNLRWDTHASNLADKRIHGTCPLGSMCHQSKLTEDAVKFIRAEYGKPGVSLASLGRRFGVTAKSVHQVVQRKSWTHIA